MICRCLFKLDFYIVTSFSIDFSISLVTCLKKSFMKNMTVFHKFLNIGRDYNVASTSNFSCFYRCI